MADETPIYNSLSNLEKRLEKHIEGTNNRLDVLIDLTRQMASMNERQQRHSDEIAKIERKLQESQQNFDQEFEKTRDRINQVSDLYLNKFQELSGTYLNGIQSLDKLATQKVDTVAKELETLRIDYDKRIASGQAVSKVLIAIFLALQGFFGKYISDVKDEFNQAVEISRSLNHRVSNLEETLKITKPNK